MPFELTRKLWYTADHERVVEDGDPEAAFLLGTPGKRIPDEEAERLGLTNVKAPAAVDPWIVALLDGVPGLTQSAAAALVGAGFATLTDLGRASDYELSAINGVGDKTIEAVRAAAPFQPPADDETPAGDAASTDAGGDETKDAE